MEFPVAKFYGKISAAKLKTTNGYKKKKDYTEIIERQLRVPKPFNTRILGPFMCWKTFYRQQEAFDFVDNTSEDLCVFAFESSTVGDSSNQSGQRRYLVTSRQQFWHHYRDLLPSQRHHYEVIREGEKCKLFFDLEFMKEFNPGRDGNKMVEILIKYVCLWLAECFRLDIGRAEVLDLDASTASKFSRHLVFQMDSAVFKDCVIAGYFVRHIFTVLLQYINLKDRKVKSMSSQASSSQNTKEHTPSYAKKSTSDNLGVIGDTEKHSSCRSLSSECMMKSRKETTNFFSMEENGDIPGVIGLQNHSSFCSEISKDVEGINKYPCPLNLSHPGIQNTLYSDRKLRFVDKVDTSRKDAALDEIVRSFQESSDDDDCSFVAQNFEDFINKPGSIRAENSQVNIWDSDCDETELSQIVERCEQEMKINLCDANQDILDFDDESDEDNDKKLVASMEELEENIFSETTVSDKDFFTSLKEDVCDDQELAGLVEDFERSSCEPMHLVSSPTGFNYDDCDDGELISLIETSEEQLLCRCDRCLSFQTPNITHSNGKAHKSHIQTECEFYGSSENSSPTKHCSLSPAAVPSNSISFCSDETDSSLEDEELLQIADLMETTLDTRQIHNTNHFNRLSLDSCVQTHNSNMLLSNRTLDSLDSGEINLKLGVSDSESTNVKSWESKQETGSSSVRDEVERVCSQFHLDELKSMLVFDKNQRQTLFCDLGVYTKNRNFRLFLSSKLRKKNPLKVSSQNQFYPPKKKHTPPATYEERLFLSSLVSVNNSQQELKVLSFGPDQHREFFYSSDTSKNLAVTSGKTAGPSAAGFKASPFPDLDCFVTSLVSGGEKEGRIRQWRHSPGLNSIVYYITGYRWCSNILREHRSNNIFYTVNLADKTYTQGCYDTDCRSAQRKVEKLPDSVSCLECQPSARDECNMEGECM